jgi:2-hydroxychromene-2-carboxylate isomerase
MRQLTFYLDFISPYAYLAFHALPKTLQGLNCQVSYQPILFGAVLAHHGQLGPAEIEGKREWTYRHALWLAHQQGCPMRMPASHPFNPLPMLRLATACDALGLPNREVCEQLFQHVWSDSLEASDPQRLADLQARLAPVRDSQSDEVKTQLRQSTQSAINKGVFGVPTILVDEKLFWGQDALPMLRAYLQGEAWFAGPAWQVCSVLPKTVERKRR